jgi:hypothetical protein
MRIFKQLLLLSALLFALDSMAYEVGQTVFYCNFDTGKVERGIVKTFQTIPALDRKPVIILENNLAIPERDIIGIWMPKMKCI